MHIEFVPLRYHLTLIMKHFLGYNILKPSLIGHISVFKMHKGTIKSSSIKVAESKSNLYSFSIHLWHFVLTITSMTDLSKALLGDFERIDLNAVHTKNNKFAR